ncbi:MAG: hypothetical protein HGB12_06595 [Bacteroidetes bacterium]|nr:hypothetical protein [Bacteroidota bacterium]
MIKIKIFKIIRSSIACALLVLFTLCSIAQSGGVAINTTGNEADTKAMLDINVNGMSPAKAGLLIPRMTTTERDAITATPPNPESLLIYNTTTKCFEAFSDNVWQPISCLCSSVPSAVSASPSSTTLCAASTLILIGNANGATTWSWTGPNNFTSTSQSPAISNIAIAGSGVYTLTASNPCGSATSVNTASVTVNPAPTATISYTGTPFCSSNSTPQSVTLTGTAGGTYTASPSGLTLNSSTGAVTPSTSTAGTYTVTYTIAASGVCGAVTATTQVTITAFPSATISYTGSPFCTSNSTPQTVTLTGTTGGAFSSTAGLTINSSSGAITPNTSTAGAYTVTYTIAASGGCSTVTATTPVTITALPIATISYSGTPFCTSNSTPQSVTLTGTTGGTFSSTAGLTINSSSGAITPSTSTAGAYTITYTIAASGACGVVTTNCVVNIGVPFIPITITNSQSSATASNFQQVISVNSSNYSSYESSGLQNIEFTTGPSATGSVLQAWIESGASNSSSNTIYWVNLGSNTIAANSTLTIYMNFMQNNIMSGSGPTGEAPQLSGTYGQYDNGANVFVSNYWNFAGTSTPSGLSLTSGFLVNNGLQLSIGSSANAYAAFTLPTSYPYIVDTYMSAIAWANVSWLSNLWTFDNPSNTMGVGGEGWWSNGNSTSPAAPTLAVFGFVQTSGNTSTYWYSNTFSTSTPQSMGGSIAANTNTIRGCTGSQSCTLSSSFPWLRVRTYPPNNVIPSVAIGSVGCQ